MPRVRSALSSGSPVLWLADRVEPATLTDTSTLPWPGGRFEPNALRFTWGDPLKHPDVSFARSGDPILLIDDAAQSHLTSFAANAWATEVDVTGRRGNIFVPGYANILTASRTYAGGSGNWAAGSLTTATAGQTGPDGTAVAYRMEIGSGGYGPYLDYTGVSGPGTYSSWVKLHSAASEWVAALYKTSPTEPPSEIFIGNGAAAWVRTVMVSNSGGVDYLFPTDGRGFLAGTTQGARDLVHDCQMFVAGITYAPPFTVGTVGAAIASVPVARTVFGGRLHCDLGESVIALEAATTPTADQYLWYADANNSLKLRQSDRKFVLRLGGSDAVATAAAQSYAINTDIGPVSWWTRADQCGLTINGVTTTASAVASIGTPSSFYLFSNNGANAFPCRAVGDFYARTALAA